MFRFTIRDVLWLMVVVSVALGWLVHSAYLHEELSKARIDEWAKNMGAKALAGQSGKPRN
jgi:hypothetical protein